jgi:hypothetical protein
VRIFFKGEDDKCQQYEDKCRSRFKNFALAEMYGMAGEHGSRFLRIDLGGQAVEGNPRSDPAASSMRILKEHEPFRPQPSGEIAACCEVNLAPRAD